MLIVEILYNLKKKAKKIYRDYFTVDGTYTSLLPDRVYIKKMYKKRMGKELDLKNPTTYTEKLNWLKLYDRKSIYTVMADKYAVRKYVAKKIGKQYLVPIIGVWDKIDEIDFTQLPEKFVLKCNHDNGVIICTNKSRLNVEQTKSELKFHLKRDYYKKLREWPYKNIKRKIICEKYMENTNGEELVDYKVFCFQGIPKFVMVNSNRFGKSDLKVDMYDMEWNHMDMQDGPYLMAGDVFEKPGCFDEMVECSKKLSKDIPFMRVDFNYWNRKLYFGELTFYHSAGMECFRPEKWDDILGDWLELPKKVKRKK